MNYKELYRIWCEKADAEYKDELSRITDEKDIEDRFYRSLEFGTAGLRGVLGAGTNRMNTHVVKQATKALADYINSIDGAAQRGVVIAYDSRIMSREFALCAALVLCKNNIKTYLFSELHPVPMLSFAVRHLKTAAGIVITASHNPPEYNGYKVYWQDGGQITPERCKPIADLIETTEIFSVESKNEDEALSCGLLKYVGKDVDEAYYAYTTSLSQNSLSKQQKDAVNIVYTPLHGSGLVPVTTLLSRMGYENVFVVKEQEMPDGKFPTVKAPNPENTENFELALDLAKSVNADIALASDPDSDRLGVCIKDENGYTALTGNKIGCLLIYYVLQSMQERGALPKDAYVVRSIVSTPLADAICAAYGVEMCTVLTGFRYIAEQIEQNEGSFIFGFEESYGFLAGTSVRDKDACLAAMLVAEACAYYKSKGKALLDILNEIERRFGAYREKCTSFSVQGKDGMAKLAEFMQKQHSSPLKTVAENKITAVTDYEKGVRISAEGTESISVPKSNVIEYECSDFARVTLRPSGTEPKLKVYVSIKAASAKDADALTEKYTDEMKRIIERSLS